MEIKRYTLKEVADMCDVKAENLYKWLRRLGLEVKKVEGKLSFTDTDILVINKIVELKNDGLTIKEIEEQLKPGKFTLTKDDALKLALQENAATLKQIAEEVNFQRELLYEQNKTVAVLEHKLEELAAARQKRPWWKKILGD
ncbi:MAG: MerR family transcriptional regulator [Firmicutes bacterium]|nr:MerR family transcriptional regulator [Bacillota bacterium]